MRRPAIGIAVAVVVTVALVILLTGPWVFHHYIEGTGNLDIHDANSLPGSVHACGRDFGRSNLGPMTFDEALQRSGVQPKLVDTVPFAPCPAGWCENGACATVVFVRVGVDSIVAYDMRGGP